MAWVRFRSKPCADVLMLTGLAHEALRLMGREALPSGLLAQADLPALLARLQEAVVQDDRRAKEVESVAQPTPTDDDQELEAPAPRLRQRLWPLMEMLRRSQAAGESVQWSG